MAIRRPRSRKGYTLIETVAAIAIMGLMMVALGRVTMVKLADQDSIDAQYDVLAADTFLADIYNDFHSCVKFDVSETALGNTQLVFNQLDGEVNIYAFYPDARECRKNGYPQFKAQSMVVQGAGNNLVVSVKLPDERVLELSIYR